MTPIRTQPAAAHSRRGFTLVELMVAVIILSIGILGLAATSAVITRQMGGGSRQTQAAAIAQSRFDSLSSINCAGLAPAGGSANGSSTSVRGVTERWIIEDGNDVKIVTDTIRIVGQLRPLIYQSYIPCRD